MTRNTQRGMTLLEVMFAMAILTVVMGVLFTLSISIGDTAALQDVRVQNNDEGRRAILGVVPRLRQAQTSSINFGEFPGDVLTFRMPQDLDGNGSAVNVGGDLETGPLITIKRDKDDVNQDGQGNEQLLLIEGENPPVVLANNLSPDSGPEAVEAGEEEPENTAGFWVEQQAGGVLLTIRTQGKSRRGTLIRQQFTELVEPRN